MNEVLKYTDDNERNDAQIERIAAEKDRLLGRLASRRICHVELLSLPATDTPLETGDVINAALYQLEAARQIAKVYEVTDQQNVIIGYELAGPVTS